jgi:vitamin B12 transporter
MRPTYAAAALAALFTTRSLAQTTPANPPPDSPENLVVTATRIPSFADAIPAGITVIDSATIAERGYVTLADALSAVPGLHIVQTGGPGSQTSVFIRGTNSNQVLVLRDGVPINDPGDPGGAFNFGSDTLGDIDRIEVVRGAMSGLYGSGAIGGVINLISKPGQGPWHGSVTVAGGAPRQGLLQGNAAGRSGIFDFAVNAQGFSDSGFDDTPRRESVYTGEVDGDRNKSAQVELGLTPFAASDTRLSVLLRARDQKYGFDDVPFDGGNATGYDVQLFGRLGVTSTLAGGAWQTSAFLSRLQDDRRYTVTYDPADINDDTQDERYHGRRTDAQWNNTVHAGDLGPFHAMNVTFGYEHIAEQADAKVDEFYPGYPDISTVKAHADTDSGTAGVQTTILDRLTATGQLREDATTIAGDAFTWRAGGVLAISEIGSHIHATYGTSFRAPALYDRYGVDTQGYRGNPGLKPERAQSWEAGWTVDLPLGARHDSASVSAAWFDNRITDLIQTEYAADFLSSTPQNVPSARTRGAETALTVRAADWLSADITYTYTDARAFGDVPPLLRRPYNQGSADLRVSPVPALNIVPEILYTGSNRDYLTLDNGGFGPIGVTRSGLIVNLNITYQVTPHMQLFVWGRNLGDSNYEPASGYQIPGTSFMAGTRVSF